MNVCYFRLCLLLLTAAMGQKAVSQCTSNAGNMDLQPYISVCYPFDTMLWQYTPIPFQAHHVGNATLDSNDVLLYFLHHESDDPKENWIDTSSTGLFDLDTVFGTLSFLRVSVIVGNNNGSGGIDMTDPCLSVTPFSALVVPTFLRIAGDDTDLCDLPFNPDPHIWSSISPLTFYLTNSEGFVFQGFQLPPVESYGTYQLTVTGGGCADTAKFDWLEPVFPICDFSVSGELSCANSIVNVSTQCTGGAPPLSIVWGDGWWLDTIVEVYTPGVYSVTITNSDGCTQLDTFVVEQNSEDCGTVIGTVTHDENENCFKEPGEPGLKNWMVRASDLSSGIVFFAYTDTAGNYLLELLPGDYQVGVVHPAFPFWENCGSALTVSVLDNADTDTANFILKTLVDCPYLEVDISTTLLRRCLENTFNVAYCNLGTATAVDALVQVTLDPLLTFNDASIPWSTFGGGIYGFEIGDLEPGDCGSFTIETTVSCDAVLDETICTEAHIFPDTACLPPSPFWSGAEIQITSECTADSVIFTLQNVGTGDMEDPSEFIVVEDGVMLMAPQEFQLQAGGSTTLSYPANGSTYAMLADQVANFPGLSSPSLAVEGCGTNNQGAFSVGFASQFPEDDAEPFLSTDCHPVVGSYDPNDKNSFPKGYTNEHLIEKGQALDYHIRFQNTGTDTAFKVVVQDVISPFLDLSTLRPGASSHPYSVEIHTDTLLFIFENPEFSGLPDSNVNEPGSHGFVKFRIGQKADNPLGTLIENKASIFFDFNDAVMTNTTTHRVGEHFLVKTGEPPLQEIEWQAFPNPFSQSVHFFTKGAEGQKIIIRLFDLAGRQVAAQPAENGFAEVGRGSLATGLIFYEILVDGVVAGRGKLAVE